ncbi:MAG: glycerol-3-phosphate acyltransferase [Clostridia bacterium]|nr:glycerol-3-phosphate acyltransferase [Clostridia bacterium]
MNALFCAVIGYLLGSVSPSALLSKIKKKNIREHGTKNLGALNTLINFGKGWGVFVMLFDIAKAVISVAIARRFFAFEYASIVAGGAAVIGHMFPFYMKFKGGKGLAPFAGFVLANHPLHFLFLFIFCVSLMFIVNYSVALPFSASMMYPFLAAYHKGNVDYVMFFLTAIICVVMIVKFWGNFRKALNGEDEKVRDFIKKQFSQ